MNVKSRMIAILAILVMTLVMLGSCAGSGDASLNQVAGGNSVNVGGNGAGNTDPSGDTNQPGNTPGGNDATPNNGETDGQGNSAGNTNNTPSGNNSSNEADPYAALKADKTGTKLSILCQNFRYNAKAEMGTTNDAKLRRYRFQELMKKYDPDILCGQECCEFWIGALQEDYGSKYDMYYFYRGSKPYGSGDEATPVLWKKDKYQKLKSGYFWLSDTPNVCSPSYVGGLPRIVNWVALKDKATGQEFYIYSAHFSLDLGPEHLVKTRKLIAEHFAKVPNDAYAFIMGDFNISYESEQYYALADGITLVDLRPASEEMAANGHCTLGDIRNGAYNGFKEDDGGVFGDFIMALPRKHLAIDTFGYCYEKPGSPANNVEPGFVSDHFAVYTELRLGSKQSYSEYFGESAK